MVSGEFTTAFSYGATTGSYNRTHYTRTIGYKQYEVSNHLGNVLVTISDKRLLYSSVGSPTEVEWYVADVQSYADYYVFGAPQTGRAGGSYRYGFNGMEQDAETKGERLSYTTEFRQYDPRVGRWLSPDPIVKPWESPYAAFANNPVLFVDPSGLTPSTGGDDPPKEEPKQQKTGFFKRLLNFLRNDKNPQTNFYTSLPDPKEFKEGSIVYIQPGGTGANGVNNTSSAAVPFVLLDGEWTSSPGGVEIIEEKKRVQPEPKSAELGKTFHIAKGYDRVREKIREYNQQLLEDLVFIDQLREEGLWDDNITWEQGRTNAINDAIGIGFATTIRVVTSTVTTSATALTKLVRPGTNALKPLGLGSTGRTVATTLQEELAMKEILANPSMGKEVIKNIGDPRWTGWSKMQYIKTLGDGTKIVIHYVGKIQNGVLQAVDDFKFK
jgi:RHS repeat-associated protein